MPHHIISNQPVSRELRCCSTTTQCTTLSRRSSSPSCPMMLVSYRPLHLLYRPPHLLYRPPHLVSEETLFPYCVGRMYSDYWNIPAMPVTSYTSILSISFPVSPVLPPSLSPRCPLVFLSIHLFSPSQRACT